MTDHPPPAREGARRPGRQLGLRSLPSVELRLLLPIAIILAGLTLFAQIAQSATLAEPNRFDTALLLLFRNPQDLGDPRGPVWFEEMVRDFTAFGSTGPLLFLTGAATGYFLLRRNYHMAGLVLLTVFGGFVLTLLLKEGFDRPRPVLVPRGTYVNTQSFPSGHSSIAAALYLTLGALVARLQRGRRLRLYVLAVALLLTFLVGLSRVYLGVHYPSDVLGGWTIGAVWATMMLVASRWWRGRRTVADAQTE
ncbi:MAG: phosphatase PAP2 family protein [Chloroflexi bacterium]|nr:phosphatase PAP2 family protein [Chloroflexota bacterium]